MKKYKPSLLIVDDDPLIIKTLHDYLEPYYQIVIAENGQMAWEKLTQSLMNFSLVITDRMMPIMGGTELTRLIKSHALFQRIPVIMVTTQAEKEEKIDAVKSGIYDFLMKPIEKDLLLLVVKRAIDFG